MNIGEHTLVRSHMFATFVEVVIQEKESYFYMFVASTLMRDLFNALIVPRISRGEIC